ncbi:AMP-binding protein [Phytohabitans kaempferiae]|uniref:AMP-binding protein n=1 Tax=Phytohabitans kaempferiae TaxID=1620943 RepID=A0ABV6M6I5_9ACTN
MDLMGTRTVNDVLIDRAGLYPQAPFLVAEDRDGRVVEFSYADFLERVRCTAGGLSQAGVRAGDSVVLHLENSAEFVLTWFAVLWAGAVAVPSNTANTASELDHVIELSEARTVITSERHGDVVVRAAAPHHGRLRVLVARGRSAHLGAAHLDEFDATPVAPAAVGSEDLAELIFTSGTTSKPKAVMLTHANCLHAGEEMSKGLALDASDRLLTTLPLFHVNAQAATVLPALTVGGTCVVLEEYSASRFLSQVRGHRATSVSLVAMQVRTLLAQPPRLDDAVHPVRRCFFVLPVTAEERAAFERRFGIRLTYGYGLSEAMMLLSLAPLAGDPHWPSIGLPTINRDVRLVDETGSEVPVGSPGEIVVAGTPGRTLMKGYFRNEGATAEALRDGWLHTGDVGRFDEDGFLFFVDRRKDVIKRSGENISAAEVETTLAAHPGVVEAAVIGVPDPIRDEAVWAYVVPDGPLEEAELLEYCRERLSAFKVPSEVVFVTSLPKTSIGKINKSLLRAEAAGGATEPGE